MLEGMVCILIADVGVLLYLHKTNGCTTADEDQNRFATIDSA